MPRTEHTKDTSTRDRQFVLERGLVQLFFGNGKGKTTAAIGGAIRMLGHGGRVLMVQMLKGEGGEEGEWFPYGELRAIERLDNFKVRQMGLPGFMSEGDKPTPAHRKIARDAIDYSRNEAASNDWDMVIVDEITEALHFDLITIEDIFDLISAKNHETELVLTGRFAPLQLIEKVDLATELIKIKHPYKKGVDARRGIEF